MFNIKEIKSRVTIFDTARILGLRLEGRGALYRSPFRDDKKPSFSVSHDGKLFNDFAKGDKGDVIDFYKLATGADTEHAITALARLAGMSEASQPPWRPMRELKRGSPQIPPLHWSEKGARMLENLRGYSAQSLKIAYERRVFGFCEYKGRPAWIVKDCGGAVAQARRIDGELWADGDGGHKAETLKNSDCSYPTGYGAAGDKPFVALCEGSTDFLAAFHFAWLNDCAADIAPLAMLGATQRISAEVLRTLKGKRVLIFPDRDSAGESALNLWGGQISPYAVKVYYFDFSPFRRIDGKPVKDLSDFMAIDPDQWETRRPYINPYFKLLTERNSDNGN